jgi:hypothetical protein
MPPIVSYAWLGSELTLAYTTTIVLRKIMVSAKFSFKLVGIKDSSTGNPTVSLHIVTYTDNILL